MLMQCMGSRIVYSSKIRASYGSRLHNYSSLSTETVITIILLLLTSYSGLPVSWHAEKYAEKHARKGLTMSYSQEGNSCSEHESIVMMPGMGSVCFYEPCSYTSYYTTA
jgi:hypothetical protein